MFNKLRNRFLLLNMTLITMVMAAAFIAIFATTYSRTQAENQTKLEAGSFAHTESVAGDPALPPAATSGPSLTQGAEQVLVRHASPGDTISFSVLVNGGGERLSVDSFLEMPDETYDEAARLAWQGWQQGDSFTTFDLGGRRWMAAVHDPAVQETTYTTASGDVHTIVSADTENHLITFLDVTDSSRSLSSLLLTFIIVFIVMLFAIAAISILFANRAIRPLREAWEQQRRFAADASHELKTPLAIITANADALLADEGEPAQNRNKWLGRIKEQTARMSALIGDLLYLSKAEDGALPGTGDVSAAPFDLSRTVADTALSMEAVVYEKGIRLSHNIQPNIHLQSDEESLRRVFTILFDNAVKYTPPGGSISLSLTKQRGHILLCIRNSGEGIAPEHLPRLFDRFYRADASRSSETGGHGLGLSIARAIAEAAGGNLWAESTPGEGAAFFLSLRG